MEKSEQDMADFARAELAVAAEQMLSERTITREGCLPLQRASNMPSGGRLLARLLSNLGAAKVPLGDRA